MYKLILLMGLLPFTPLPASTTLRVMSPADATDIGILPILKDIFMDSFHAVYIKDWTPEIAQQTKNIFESYISQYQINSAMILVTVSKDEQMAGWALFKKQTDTDVILEILCISPHFWRQGIGTQLVFSLCDEYPSINHISLMTRKINLISPQFYEALGFKKTDFCLPEYGNFENLQGYEWHK